jgi:DNA polymerase III epsilon subunit-like protein
LIPVFEIDGKKMKRLSETMYSLQFRQYNSGIDFPRLWEGIQRRLLPVFAKFYEKKPDYGPLIFFDTETTGLMDSDIIELGALSVNYDPVDGGVKLDAFCKLINPGSGIIMPPWVIEIHGITNEMLRKYGHPPRGTLLQFLEWAQSKSPKYFVAHCASFDKGMLENDLLKHGIDFSLPEFLCTRKMAKGLPIENKKLGTIAKYFNYANQQAHRGLTDAEVCAYIFAQISLTMPLAGQTVIVAGDLPSLSKESAESMLSKLGAKVGKRLTNKTSLLIAGEKAGDKLEKAIALGIPVRDEAWLIGL